MNLGLTQQCLNVFTLFCLLRTKLPGTSMEKLKSGIFYDPQISQIFKNSQFTTSWCLLAQIVQNSLDNRKTENYIKLVIFSVVT